MVDGNSSKNPLIVKTLSSALNAAPTSVKSPLIGQVLSVNINQNKLIKKYLTPAGSSCSTPVENSPESVDISSLGLKLEQSTFFRNTTARPCIVINVEPRPLEVELEEPPNITIVLITGFNGKALDQVMAEEEFKRLMPISPTPSLPGTAATPINTTPEWIPHSRRRVPSYILCIPIKVHSLYLHRFEEPIQLDEQNLEKLKVHILALGGIEANADFVDLEEEEENDESDDDDDDESDDDDVELSYGQFKRLISWDEITL